MKPDPPGCRAIEQDRVKAQCIAEAADKAASIMDMFNRNRGRQQLIQQLLWLISASDSSQNFQCEGRPVLVPSAAVDRVDWHAIASITGSALQIIPQCLQVCRAPGACTLQRCPEHLLPCFLQTLRIACCCGLPAQQD